MISYYPYLTHWMYFKLLSCFPISWKVPPKRFSFDESVYWRTEQGIEFPLKCSRLRDPLSAKGNLIKDNHKRQRNWARFAIYKEITINSTPSKNWEKLFPLFILTKVCASKAQTQKDSLVSLWVEPTNS